MNWLSQKSNRILSGTTMAAEILRWLLNYINPAGVYIWDLVAAVHTTNSDLCRQEKVHVQVVTEPGDEEGLTIVIDNQLSNATVYLAAQVEEIKRTVAQSFCLREDVWTISTWE